MKLDHPDSTSDRQRFSRDWLQLREVADAAARCLQLVDPVREHLTGRTEPVIRDLGCGTGAMQRWLAARLAGRQRWIMHDLDTGLLDVAQNSLVSESLDGSPVIATVERRDITHLTGEDLADTALVTASALLDLLTMAEVERVVNACAIARCPALLTLTVIGRVEFSPPDPLDRELTIAFNSYQCQAVAGRRPLGPDAVEATVTAFERAGAAVLVHASPWRLSQSHMALAVEWLRDWVANACAHRPELAGHSAGYLDRRIAAATAGKLAVVVHHQDLLARFA